MSSERINNLSFKKLEKSLINFTQNKLPSFRINPITPKISHAFPLNDGTRSTTNNANIRTSFSPTNKIKNKETQQIPVNYQYKKKDERFILTDNDSMQVDTQKISTKKEANFQNDVRSLSRPNLTKYIPESKNINNKSINTSQNRDLKSNSPKIKIEVNHTTIQNINNYHQNICNTVNNNFYPFQNDTVNRPANDKNNFNNPSFSSKIYADGNHTNNSFINSMISGKNYLKSTSIESNNQVGTLLNNNNSFNNISNINLTSVNNTVKNKNKTQSPLNEKKNDTRPVQYQRNIKVSSVFNNNVNLKPQMAHFPNHKKNIQIEANVGNQTNVSYQNYFAKINNYENSKYGMKPNGIVTSYAANTNQGLFR